MPNKQLALWVDKVFRGDEIFDPKSRYNLDDRLSAVRCLRDRFARAGWDCHTADVYAKNGVTPDAVVFFDIPPQPLSKLVNAWPGARKYAVLFECSVIKPQNWELGRHREFDGVFTWSDALVDGKKYFKIHFPQNIPAGLQPPGGKRDKFCVLIAGNKKSTRPLELYSERVNTIRWFERNRPGEFDLYGIGWDRRLFTGPLPVRALNRVPVLARLLAERFPSYRGEAAAKRTLLAGYKFSICYENARDIPGYITEKIFDCLMSGCIPVYWGAPDITRYVPADCFIDRREFASHEALYAYMSAMSDLERKRRIEAMAAYLNSEAIRGFTDGYFAETVAGEIAGRAAGAEHANE